MNGHPTSEIAPQPFNLLLVLSVLSIVLSYCSAFCSDHQRDWLNLVNSVPCLLVTLSFRTYLKNFNAEKAIYRINVYMGIFILFTILTIIKDLTSLFHHLVFLYYSCYIILFLLFIYAAIQFGISLLNIKNDTIGLLYELGISFISVVPLSIVAAIILAFTKLVSKTTKYALIYFILSIPCIIITLIFYRAKTHLQSSQKRDLDI